MEDVYSDVTTWLDGGLFLEGLQVVSPAYIYVCIGGTGMYEDHSKQFTSLKLSSNHSVTVITCLRVTCLHSIARCLP